MLRPKIGLDWDDVTAPFNSIAIAMANEKYHIDPPLRLEEIDTWENYRSDKINIRYFHQAVHSFFGKTVDVQVLSGNFTRTKNSMHASRFRRKTKKLCTA